MRRGYTLRYLTLVTYVALNPEIETQNDLTGRSACHRNLEMKAKNLTLVARCLSPERCLASY